MGFPLARSCALWLACLAVFAAQAQVASQSGAQSSSRARTKPAATALQPDGGVISNGVYRNRFFNFSYALTAGWVDRTDVMQEDAEAGKSLVLLALFEHPPEASAPGPDPAVVIAAEKASSYPGVKTAADYFDPLSEAAVAQGFKVVNQPYDFSAGAGLVRADFRKNAGKTELHQSSLVLLSKGWIVSFTFLDSSDDAVEALIEKLSFAKPAPRK